MLTFLVALMLAVALIFIIPDYDRKSSSVFIRLSKAVFRVLPL